MEDSSEGMELEVIVGTYEEFLLGYKVTKSEDDEEYKLVQSFTNHSHSGSVRSVAVIGKYLASGSADEAIRLINMAQRVEHGYMQQQTGTITCLDNYGSGYLFSGCEDGTICIWKGGSWICEKTLKAHRGGVDGVSLHPSGKLALSVGRDKTLKTWNLIKGRTGFVTNLHGNGEAVKWSPDGAYYAVSVSNRVDVYSIQTAKVVYSIPFGKRASCISFAKPTVMMVAGDKDSVEVHDIAKSAKLSEFKAHKVRVKGIQFVEAHDLLVTGSNCDGHIKLWKYSDENYASSPKLLAEVDTTCRITCLTVWSKQIADINAEIASADPETEEVDEVVNDSNEEEMEEEQAPKKSKVKAKKSHKLKQKAAEAEKSRSESSSASSSLPKKKRKKSTS